MIAFSNSNDNSLGLIFVFGIVLCIYLYGGGYEAAMKENSSRVGTSIFQKVASDAEDQYNIAKRNGSKADAYFRAGVVASAYLQAKDEANYKKWLEIKKEEGILAGIPSRE